MSTDMLLKCYKYPIDYMRAAYPNKILPKIDLSMVILALSKVSTVWYY